MAIVAASRTISCDVFSGKRPNGCSPTPKTTTSLDISGLLAFSLGEAIHGDLLPFFYLQWLHHESDWRAYSKL